MKLGIGRSALRWLVLSLIPTAVFAEDLPTNQRQSDDQTASIEYLGSTCDKAFDVPQSPDDSEVHVVDPKITGVGPGAYPAPIVSYSEYDDRSLLLSVSYVQRSTYAVCLFVVRVTTQSRIKIRRSFRDQSFLEGMTNAEREVIAAMVRKCRALSNERRSRLFPGGNISVDPVSGMVVTIDDGIGTCEQATLNNMTSVDVVTDQETVRISTISDRIFIDGVAP